MTVSNASAAQSVEVTRGLMVHGATDDQVAVYRLLDGAGALLYVGISRDPFGRWQEHRSKSWWRQVVSYEVQWFPSRTEARAEEKQAMKDEGAAHNVHSAPRYGAYLSAALNTPEAKASRAQRRKSAAAKDAEASDG